ncbi:MAG: hypothetical protein ACO3LE_11175, partial [Bdellovibrionota bacterium]
MSCLYFLLLNLFFVDSNSEVIFELPIQEAPSESTPKENDFKPQASLFEPDQFFEELRAAPDLEAAFLLKLNSRYQIIVLREEGDWIEVDALSPENFEFRGWIKKRAIPAAPPVREISVIQKEKEEASPIESEKFRWFWEADWNDRGEWGLPLGIQNIRLSQTGETEEDGSVLIPGYQFSGFSLGSSLRFSIFETYWRSYRSRLQVEASYQWGFYQVRFASNFDPIDVAGDAYNLQTHRYQTHLWQDMRFLLGSSFVVTPALGFGYLYFESAPQLKRTDVGDIIFTENSLSAFLMSLRAQLNWKDKIYILPSLHLPLFSTVTETPESFSGSGDRTLLKRKSFPLFIQLETD